MIRDARIDYARHWLRTDVHICFWALLVGASLCIGVLVLVTRAEDAPLSWPTMATWLPLPAMGITYALAMFIGALWRWLWSYTPRGRLRLIADYVEASKADGARGISYAENQY